MGAVERANRIEPARMCRTRNATAIVTSSAFSLGPRNPATDLARDGSSLADIGSALDSGFQFTRFARLGARDQMLILPKKALGSAFAATDATRRAMLRKAVVASMRD
jgi:hypothetical protein